MTGRAWKTVLSIAAAVLVACQNAGEDRVLGIEAVGTVAGIVYFDANATRGFEPAVDPRLEGVRIGLVPTGTTDTVTAARSDEDGVFEMAGVSVGNYRIVVDTATLGDTASVVGIDAEDVNVHPNDTLVVEVAIGFPRVTVAEALALPIGDRVFVDGIALNGRETFGDSTLHVADTSGALRAVRAGPGPVFPGDSIRLRGQISTRDGRAVLDLDRGTPIVLAIAELPPPDTVSTASAAAAGGGALDAALVRIDGAAITDTATVGDDVVVTVDDGSGPLEILLDQDIAFAPQPFMVPGAELEVTGLLVVAGGGGWQLKPRSDADLQVVAPVIPVAEARGRATGDQVFVDGIALNDIAAFADSTLHVIDTSGAVRATRVRPASIFPGDSVRLIGVMAIRDGQPVIDQATPIVLAVSRVPAAPRLSTAAATTADGGALDAALVRITNVTIGDTATVAGDFVLTVDDGSGAVEVLLDQDIGFFLAPLDPGVVIDATGVLVPTGAGAWQIKPRRGSDLIVKGAP